jgi:hypothetical protein
VAHPVLNGPYVKPPSQHSGGTGETKRLQINFVGSSLGARRDGFAMIEHVLFAVSGNRLRRLLLKDAQRERRESILSSRSVFAAAQRQRSATGSWSR